MAAATTPTATYRLQFNASFTFDDATAIVDYLSELGVSHCYASSYLAAVPGSLHGYDVTDPTRLNPELGGEEAFERWIAALRQHGMGHIVDVVPNHMGIANSANPWWQDVLENGPNSRHARVFDIDWHPLKPELQDRVLLPILGDAYGAVLDGGQIRLEYSDGAFNARYFAHTLPISPGTYGMILETGIGELLERVGEESELGVELLSILTAINHLPQRHVSDSQLRRERAREKEVIKRRLATLNGRSPDVRAHIAGALETFNGTPGDPRSFDRLDALLSAQAYRLAYWRVAAEEINYRRFFDINELAAIRMEDPVVFERVHGLLFDLIARGAIDGLRVDHVDGLYDPGAYLDRLQARLRQIRGVAEDDQPLYVVVEKILGRDEYLPQWPVHGTTGYEFLGWTNGLFVDSRNEQPFTGIYEAFTRRRATFREVCYWGKAHVLQVAMAGELNVLARGLSRFAERNRYSRDFTLNSLRRALREVIACFPVYRTYVNAREPVSPQDRTHIEHAVREAKKRDPNQPSFVFDFIEGLLLKRAEHTGETRDEHMSFLAKFQQVTSPVTAKGIEDTALYIYNRLVPLNEVGSEPDRFGIAPDALHRWLATRAERWPHAMSASSTHDTKRSEDVRARLNVLAEIPGAWKQAIARWARINRRGHSILDGHSYPSRNEEYLLYQTLVGTWPFARMDASQEREYEGRILDYMQKAMREAKVFTSWLNPSERHEEAMARFVRFVLAPDNVGFREDFIQFTQRVARHGVYNSLAMLTLKIGAPGVPDFYRGTETWDFSLVDPDNRRPLDFEDRRSMLRTLDCAVATTGPAAVAEQLVADPGDPRLKLFTTSTLLRFRRTHADLFQDGAYEPLQTSGARAEHLFAFSRTLDGRTVIVAVPRMIVTLQLDAEIPPLGERVWGDTRIEVPAGHAMRYRHVITGECVHPRLPDYGQSLAAADLFARFPVAVLHAQ